MVVCVPRTITGADQIFAGSMILRRYQVNILEIINIYVIIGNTFVQDDYGSAGCLMKCGFCYDSLTC